MTSTNSTVSVSQTTYDEIITYVLQTISSKDYLENYNIPISDPLYDKSLIKFIDDYNQGKAKPGIYPISDWTVDIISKNFNKPPEEIDIKALTKFALENSLHFYSIREKTPRKGLLVNAYPSATLISGDVNKAIGLDFQKDHSHGFCQTFALMNYIDPKALKEMEEGKYLPNAYKALMWIHKFTKNNDFEFKISKMDISATSKKTLSAFLTKINKPSKDILLSQLTMLCLKPELRHSFYEWFYF